MEKVPKTETEMNILVSAPAPHLEESMGKPKVLLQVEKPAPEPELSAAPVLVQRGPASEEPSSGTMNYVAALLGGPGGRPDPQNAMSDPSKIL